MGTFLETLFRSLKKSFKRWFLLPKGVSKSACLLKVFYTLKRAVIQKQLPKPKLPVSRQIFLYYFLRKSFCTEVNFPIEHTRGFFFFWCIGRNVIPRRKPPDLWLQYKARLHIQHHIVATFYKRTLFISLETLAIVIEVFN